MSARKTITRLQDLTDVKATPPTDGQIPIWVTANNRFEFGPQAGGGGGGAPSGPAGGVLGGTYPNPAFAVDMATQAELDAEATTRAAAVTAEATARANADAALQPLDSDLTAIAALATTGFGRGLLILANAAALRTAAGLGTAALNNTGDFDLAGAAASAQAASQPLDPDLTAIAALATTAYGRSLLAAADAAALRTLAGAVIGTDVQAFDAELAALAGLVSAADRLPYFTGSGTAALTVFTAAGRALVDDIDAAAQRTTLGLVIGTDVVAFGDARLSDSRAPNGAASGDLGGTYPGPTVAAIHETAGPTKLVIGAVADGQFLKRVGATLVGAAGGGGAVASDVIWDTKGDIAIATAADTAVKHPAPVNGAYMIADSTQTDGWRDVPDGGSMWLPQDSGLLGWMFDPVQMASNSNLTAATIFLGRIRLRRTTTITNIELWLGTVGVTLTNSYAGLWTSAGVLLSSSADQSSGGTNWTAGTGRKSVPLAAAQTITVANGSFVDVYVGAYVGTATTAPQIGSMTHLTGGPGNFGLGATALRVASIAQANGVLANFSTAGIANVNQIRWFGIS